MTAAIVSADTASDVATGTARIGRNLDDLVNSLDEAAARGVSDLAYEQWDRARDALFAASVALVQAVEETKGLAELVADEACGDIPADARWVPGTGWVATA